MTVTLLLVNLMHVYLGLKYIYNIVKFYEFLKVDADLIVKPWLIFSFLEILYVSFFFLVTLKESCTSPDAIERGN